MKNKIVVIGCGNVGMAYIYALVNQINPIDEIVLIDTNEKRIEGEVMDLNHCLALSPNSLQIKIGDYEDCKDAAVVCITAGASQTLGSRMDGLKTNCKLFDAILDKVVYSGFTGIYLIASNPLDIMTYYTYKRTQVSPEKVIGSGTILDSSRLRYLLSEKLNVSPKSIDAYVIGEHGDSGFVPWSQASIAHQPLTQFLSPKQCLEMERKVREAGYEIVKRKGATYYGIGEGLARITTAILKDEKVILPVSNYDKQNDVYMSTPCVIDKNGISQRIFMQITEEEEQKLEASISVMKKAISEVN